MDTCMAVFTNLLMAALHTTAAIMDTPFLEMISAYVKPMEYGRVNNQRVVSWLIMVLDLTKFLDLVTTNQKLP